MYFLMVPGSFLCLTVYYFDLLAGLMAGAYKDIPFILIVSIIFI